MTTGTTTRGDFNSQRDILPVRAGARFEKGVIVEREQQNMEAVA